MAGEWADRLERRLGFLALPGLPLYVVGMSGAVGVLSLLKPEFRGVLALFPDRVLDGQVWRLLTFLVVPPASHPLWLALWLALVYACLQAMENAWGDFKLTLYVLLGALATGAGALATGAAFGPSMIHLSAFLGFARLMPDREVLVLFILPVKLRWLAGLAAVLVAAEFVAERLPGRVYILAGLLPYLLFFGPGHWRDAKLAWRRRGGA